MLMFIMRNMRKNTMHIVQEFSAFVFNGIILCYKFLINLLAATDFSSLSVEHISISLSCTHFLKELL